MVISAQMKVQIDNFGISFRMDKPIRIKADLNNHPWNGRKGVPTKIHISRHDTRNCIAEAKDDKKYGSNSGFSIIRQKLM